MNSLQDQHQTTPSKHTANNLDDTPSLPNASFSYLRIGTQSNIWCTVTPPTPLVSIPPLSLSQNIDIVRKGAPKEMLPNVEERDYMTSFVDWNAESRWSIDSEVKWTGRVEYPESCERSSIAREAEHRINAESEADKKSRKPR